MVTRCVANSVADPECLIACHYSTRTPYHERPDPSLNPAIEPECLPLTRPSRTQASLRPSPKPSAANSEYMSGRDLSGDEAATDQVAAGVPNLLALRCRDRMVLAEPACLSATCESAERHACRVMLPDSTGSVAPCEM